MAWYLTTQDLFARYLLSVPVDYHKGLWDMENPPLSQLRLLMSCFWPNRPVRLNAGVIPLAEDPSAAIEIQAVLRAVALSEGRDDLDINITTAPSIPVPAIGDVLHLLRPAAAGHARSSVDRAKGLDLPYQYLRMRFVASSLRDYSDERDRTYEARKAEEAADRQAKHDRLMRDTLALNAHWERQRQGIPGPGAKPDDDKDS